jgi:hypothetical protein
MRAALPYNFPHFAISDDMPMDGEVHKVVRGLQEGQATGMGWSMYQGYLAAFCFNENCLLVVINSRVWDEVIILCFRGASGSSTLLT